MRLGHASADELLSVNLEIGKKLDAMNEEGVIMNEVTKSYIIRK